MRLPRPSVLRKEHAFATFGIITHLTFTYFPILGSGAACKLFHWKNVHNEQICWGDWGARWSHIKNYLGHLGDWPRGRDMCVSLPQIKCGVQKKIMIRSMLTRTANYEKPRFRHSWTASGVYHVSSMIKLKSMPWAATANVDFFPPQMEGTILSANRKWMSTEPGPFQQEQSKWLWQENL